MLIIIVLVVVSIAFPPAWLALVAYVVYLVLTKKSRRNKAIFNEIRKLIATGEGEIVLKNIYYESAKSFAADHGASMSKYKNDPEDDCLIVGLLIDGVEYSVCFQRWMKDETILSLKTKEKSKEDLIGLLGIDGSRHAQLLGR